MKNGLKDRHHKVELSDEFRANTVWCQELICRFNGLAKILDSRLVTSLHTDACNTSCGGVYMGDYFYINWQWDLPVLHDLHINYKETIAIIAAAVRWGKFWRDKRVIVKTDNCTAKSIINKGTCRNNLVMMFLRGLFLESVKYNFALSAAYVPGKVNVMADRCSRLHEKSGLTSLFDSVPSLNVTPFSVNELTDHMSQKFLTHRWNSVPQKSGESCFDLQISRLVNICEKTYMVHLETYLKFCDSVSVEPVPLPDDILECYIAYLAKVKCFKYSTIVCYLNIVSHVHECKGFPSPVNTSWGVKKVLLGVKRVLRAGQDCVKPITPYILCKLKSSLKITSGEAFWAACLVAFFGMLRPNNLLLTEGNQEDKFVRTVDVTAVTDGFILNLRHMKTQVVWVFVPKVVGHQLCPATALKAYLDVPHHAQILQPLFINSDNSPLTYRGFLSKLQSHLDKGGFHGKKSFRRGGATLAYKCGVADKMIQCIGCWASDTYLRYIDVDSKQQLAAVKSMVQLYRE